MGSLFSGATRRMGMHGLAGLVLSGLLLFSCKSGAPVVRPLFMQSKRANVGLPGDAAGLQATLQERV
ncbi:hypothetical protein ACFO6W_02930, partial [Dysgonomonas termitidis]